MFKGYKTIIVNAVIALLAAIELAAEIDIAGADETAIVAGVLALANLGLRVVTKGPVGEAAPMSAVEAEYLSTDIDDLERDLEEVEAERDEAEAKLVELLDD